MDSPQPGLLDCPSAALSLHLSRRPGHRFPSRCLLLRADSGSVLGHHHPEVSREHFPLEPFAWHSGLCLP